MSVSTYISFERLIMSNCMDNFSLHIISSQPFWSKAQFHQRSTYSFCTCWAQKRKKILMTYLYLFTLLEFTGAKAAHRTLMKLTPDFVFSVDWHIQMRKYIQVYDYFSGVNFINVKRANFTYECAFVRLSKLKRN